MKEVYVTEKDMFGLIHVKNIFDEKTIKRCKSSVGVANYIIKNKMKLVKKENV